MEKISLIFTSSTDIHTDTILKYSSESVKIIRLDLDSPNDWSLSFFNNEILIKTDKTTYGLDNVNSVFVRRLPNPDSFIKAVNPKYEQFSNYIGQNQYFLFSDCLSILDETKFFINPLASSSRSGKAIQEKIAFDAGLLTPQTYMGSNETVARQFIDIVFKEQKKICTKPIINTKVKIAGKDHTRFTEILDEKAISNLNTLEFCPTIFQEYIPKEYEIRATVVGDKIFAARIDSQKAGGNTSTDWRQYNIPKTPHYPINLPKEIEEKIFKIQQRLGLIYSAFDLIYTPSGDYVFLETNPYGQWLWIEDLTGLQISKSISSLLTSAH